MQQKDISSYYEQAVKFAQNLPQQIERVKHKQDQFLLAIKRRKTYKEKLQYQFQHLDEVVDKDQKIIELTHYIQEIITSRNFMKDKLNKINQEILNTQNQIDRKREHLDKLIRTSKETNHQAFLLKYKFSQFFPKQTSKSGLRVLKQPFLKQIVLVDDQLQKAKHEFNQAYFRQTDFSGRFKQLVNFQFEQLKKKKLLSRQVQSRLRFPKRNRTQEKLASSTLQEREWRLIVNGNVQRFEKRLQKRSVQKVTYQQFKKLSGQQIFQLVVSRPEIFSRFQSIMDSNLNELYGVFKSYKSLMNERQ